MCGICGQINFDHSPIQADALERMTKAIEHRGPDAHGIYVKENIGLGHQRLSIIDLSDEATQPMHNDAKTVSIVYNGELYNYQALQKELEQLGAVFRTSSDTEVLLKAYQVWGIDCLQKLDGMFAFAIWDHQEQRLFLARDRVGIKPLYYYYEPSRKILAKTFSVINPGKIMQLSKPKTQSVIISGLHH